MLFYSKVGGRAMIVMREACAKRIRSRCRYEETQPNRLQVNGSSVLFMQYGSRGVNCLREEVGGVAIVVIAATVVVVKVAGRCRSEVHWCSRFGRLTRKGMGCGLGGGS